MMDASDNKLTALAEAVLMGLIVGKLDSHNLRYDQREFIAGTKNQAAREILEAHAAFEAYQANVSKLLAFVRSVAVTQLGTESEMAAQMADHIESALALVADIAGSEVAE